MVRVLDVIWIYDTEIDPANWKMAVCVAPKFGLFFRINSRDHWEPAVAIRAADHGFLKWDSYIECGNLLVLDESMIEDGLVDDDPIGSIHVRIVADILAAVAANPLISELDKRSIRNALANVR